MQDVWDQYAEIRRQLEERPRLRGVSNLHIDAFPPVADRPAPYRSRDVFGIISLPGQDFPSNSHYALAAPSGGLPGVEREEFLALVRCAAPLLPPLITDRLAQCCLEDMREINPHHDACLWCAFLWWTHMDWPPIATSIQQGWRLPPVFEFSDLFTLSAQSIAVCRLDTPDPILDSVPAYHARFHALEASRSAADAVSRTAQVVAWQCPPAPSLPKTITSTSDRGLRRRAETAWNAGHELIEAIDAWCVWVVEARTANDTEGAAWLERGNTIAKSAVAAMKSLKLAEVTGDVDFMVESPESDEPSPWGLPPAPAELFDVSYYLEPHDEERERIDARASMMACVLRPAVSDFLGLLSRSVAAVLLDLTDESAFAPAGGLWRPRFKSYKKFKKWLDQQPEGRIRRRSPRSNRLDVHVGDWHSYWNERDRQHTELLDDEALQETIADIEARKAAIRRQKRSK
jgi:hypothetical protein